MAAVASPLTPTPASVMNKSKLKNGPAPPARAHAHAKHDHHDDKQQDGPAEVAKSTQVANPAVKPSAPVKHALAKSAPGLTNGKPVTSSMRSTKRPISAWDEGLGEEVYYPQPEGEPEAEPEANGNKPIVGTKTDGNQTAVGTESAVPPKPAPPEIDRSGYILATGISADDKEVKGMAYYSDTRTAFKQAAPDDLEFPLEYYDKARWELLRPPSAGFFTWDILDIAPGSAAIAPLKERGVYVGPTRAYSIYSGFQRTRFVHEISGVPYTFKDDYWVVDDLNLPTEPKYSDGHTYLLVTATNGSFTRRGIAGYESGDSIGVKNIPDMFVWIDGSGSAVNDPEDWDDTLSKSFVLNFTASLSKTASNQDIPFRTLVGTAKRDKLGLFVLKDENAAEPTFVLDKKDEHVPDIVFGDSPSGRKYGDVAEPERLRDVDRWECYTQFFCEVPPWITMEGSLI